MSILFVIAGWYFLPVIFLALPLLALPRNPVFPWVLWVIGLGYAIREYFRLSSIPKQHGDLSEVSISMAVYWISAFALAFIVRIVGYRWAESDQDEIVVSGAGCFLVLFLPIIFFFAIIIFRGSL